MKPKWVTSGPFIPAHLLLQDRSQLGWTRKAVPECLTQQESRQVTDKLNSKVTIEFLKTLQRLKKVIVGEVKAAAEGWEGFNRFPSTMTPDFIQYFKNTHCCWTPPNGREIIMHTRSSQQRTTFQTLCCCWWQTNGYRCLWIVSFGSGLKYWTRSYQTVEQQNGSSIYESSPTGIGKVPIWWINICTPS